MPFLRYYLPEMTVQKSENMHYQQWEKEGRLDVTPGARTDFEYIEVPYILSTVWYHTLHAMRPASEKGDYRHFKNFEYLNGNIFLGDGIRYRGRGYVPLAGRDNHEQFGKCLGLDLVGNPDNVSNPDVAWRIMGSSIYSRVIYLY